MNLNTYTLASNADARRVRHSSSSESAHGLTLQRIIKPELLGRETKLTGSAPSGPPALAERVFKALADAKVWTSHVAMHMDRATRDRYFRQLDLLHDCDEWFGDESPVRLGSYKGFVRFMLLIGGSSKPSLALAPNGGLIAVWQSAGDRLTIEFTSENSAQWVVTKQMGDRTERAAGSTVLARLPAVIAPYAPETWFGAA